MKYLKAVVKRVLFSLTFKSVTSSNSNKQMAARNTLKPASCLRWTHHFGVLASWLTLIFISFGFDPRQLERILKSPMTSELQWWHLGAFYLKEEIRAEMAIHLPSNGKKKYNDIICGFSWSSWSKLLRLYREEVILLEGEMFWKACSYGITCFCW